MAEAKNLMDLPIEEIEFEIRRVCYSMMKGSNNEDIKDVIQNANLKLVRRVCSRKPVDQIIKLAKQIARSEVRDFFRKMQRQPKTVEMPEEEDVVAEEEDVVSIIQIEEMIPEFLERLNDEQRKIFEMVLDDRRNVEIAGALRISPQKTSIAIKRMKSMLKFLLYIGKTTGKREISPRKEVFCE